MHEFIDRMGDDQQRMNDAIEIIQGEFPTLTPANIEIGFNHFAYMVGFSSIHVLQTFRVEGRQQNTFLSFVQMKYMRYARGKSAIQFSTERDLQSYVIVKLSSAFGHFIIKKESLANKIMELFQPLELDFAEDAEFSRKFYVLSKDKQKTISFITPKFMELLKPLNDSNAFFELINDTLIIGNGMPAGHHSIIELIKLGCEIDRLMNR